VIAREDVPGEKRLVAYITVRKAADEKTPLSIDALRAHLKPLLPEHMVPSAYVVLNSFPLTPNGKLDRRALPAPKVEAYLSAPYEAPQGEVEETLAAMWRALLRAERVGRQDNFFALGGESLQGAKLIATVAQRLGVDLSDVTVFQCPSILEMARVVARAPKTIELQEGAI
jgi:Phosphopantetheine attachment site/AMP-binding enzyme C-terminal domain